MHFPRSISILGMHRSGTSCLAGSLQLAGLFLGDVSEKNPHNLKGNREHPLVMELNEAVLLASGGNWAEPPNCVVWTDELKERRAAVIELLAVQEPWGFKDPRTLLTLEGWLEALPEMQFAGTFRSPMLVAESLRLSRSKFPMQRGLDLWKSYNRILLAQHQRRPFPLICFDVTAAVFQEKLALVCDALGLNPAMTTGENAFFTEELRHQKAGDAGPAECPDAEATEIYEALLAQSL